MVSRPLLKILAVLTLVAGLSLWAVDTALAAPSMRCVEGVEAEEIDPLTFARCLASLPTKTNPESESNPNPGDLSNTPGTSTEVYIVQRGDTLYSISVRYGTTVAALVEANHLANASLIYVGQRLVIPTGLAVEFDPPILAVALSPPTVLQGRTLLIRVETEGQAAIAGELDGRALAFFGGGGEYWAVAGFPPWASPGAYAWLIVAQGQNGQEGEARGTVLVTDFDFPIDYIDLPPDREGLLAPEITVPERDRLAQIFSQLSPQPFWEDLFRLPVSGRKSSFFGEGRSYDGGPVASYHLGVDYSADEGTPVYAANSGHVVLAETLQVRGNTVAIDHGLGVYTGYFHLSSIVVSAGQEVQKGDLIGYVGSTGLATGPHLHWEMRIGDIPVDPEEWTTRSFPP